MKLKYFHILIKEDNKSLSCIQPLNGVVVRELALQSRQFSNGGTNSILSVANSFSSGG